MNLTIIAPDNTVIIDGYPLNFDLSALIATDVHAVQWSGTTGEVEYTPLDKPNDVITDLITFQPIVDEFFTQKIINDAAIAASADTPKDVKIKEIREAFHVAVKSFMTQGVLMDAGANSIQLFKNGYDLALQLGMPSMDIRDFNNSPPINKSLSVANTMIQELGANYLAKLAIKWALQDAVTALPDTASKADVDKIIVAF